MNCSHPRFDFEITLPVGKWVRLPFTDQNQTYRAWFHPVLTDEQILDFFHQASVLDNADKEERSRLLELYAEANKHVFYRAIYHGKFGSDSKDSGESTDMRWIGENYVEIKVKYRKYDTDLYKVSGDCLNCFSKKPVEFPDVQVIKNHHQLLEQLGSSLRTG